MAKYKFIPNQISILISIGIAGFLLAVLMLGGKGCNHNIKYREIVLSNKHEVVTQIYANRLSRLRDTISKMEADTGKYAKVLPGARKVFIITFRDSLVFSTGNADTSLRYFAGLLFVNRDSLSTAITAEWSSDNKYTRDVIFTYMDTTPVLYATPRPETVTFRLQRAPHRTLMTFFAANPLFAFWLIFSVAQLTLWFLVVPLLAALRKTLKNKVTDVPTDLVSIRNWLLSCLLPLIFFALFCWLFYWRLIDDMVIRDQYFMEGFNNTMKWYATFGYITAIACFGMYLLTSMSLDYINENAQTNKWKLNSTPVLQANYEALKKAFDNSFLASAIILSVFVLWLGITFNAINQTEGMRFYALYAGKPFLPNDYVYLTGAMHTVILLLFYIPVKIKFNSLQITEEAKAAGSANGKKILNNLYESIIAILVTASPLITSIIQKLFSGMI